MLSSLARRILTGTSLGLGVAVLLFLHVQFPGLRVPFVAATVLSVLGAIELASMDGLRELRLGLPLVLAALGGAAVAVVGIDSERPEVSFWLAYAAAAFLALATHVGRRALGVKLPERTLAWTLGLAVWAAVALHGFGVIDSWWGVSGVFAIILLCKIGDIFGYFVGRAIGKRRPFKKISPNKTVAGCVASLVAGVVAGALVGGLGLLPVGELPWLGGAVAGLLLNLSSQAGDLLESWVKRSAGVKDSGTVFGPAGGVLDVVDSLLTSFPVVMLLWTLWFSRDPFGS